MCVLFPRIPVPEKTNVSVLSFFVGLCANIFPSEIFLMVLPKNTSHYLLLHLELSSHGIYH